MIKVFVSYALEDQSGSEAIQKGLAILRRQKKLAFFDQHKDPDGNRAESIRNALKASEIILLLISNNFIASDECFDIQEQALTMQKNGLTRLIPILYNNCEWKELEIGQLQALPRNKTFISNWSNQDAAFAEVSKEIGALTKRMLNQSATETKSTKLSVNLDFDKLVLDIGQGKIKEVLMTLYEAVPKSDRQSVNEIILLQSRLSNLRQDKQNGILSNEEAELRRNQLHHSALSLINRMRESS